MKIISDRELEIEKFQSEEYWSIKGLFKNKENQEIESRLITFDGKKIDKLDIKNEQNANLYYDEIIKSEFKVSNIINKESKRNPYPPFATSTMQIESSRKLGLSANQTMRIAQKLYEGLEIDGEPTGLITYMRTDSVIMSNDAIKEIRTYVEQKLGKNYIPDNQRIYKSKAKNAQEAHECIRPTNINLTPQSINKYLSTEEFKLYEIIWQRAVSSQMASAIINQVAVDIQSENKLVCFRANGSSIKFPGMLAVYHDAKEDDAKEDEEAKILPPLNLGENLKLQKAIKNQHFTLPPPRYTEASLVKKLEELGI